MALPRIHPLRKTYVDLRRSKVRLDEFIAHIDEEDADNAEIYLELYEGIKELMNKIPKEFTE